MKNEVPEYGFVFSYRNHRIGKSKPVDSEFLRKADKATMNSDNLLIFCKPCGMYMNSYEGSSFAMSFWKCPSCGVRVRMTTAYTQLDRENQQFIEEFEDSDDVPEECKNCPEFENFPFCQGACPLQDD